MKMPNLLKKKAAKKAVVAPYTGSEVLINEIKLLRAALDSQYELLGLVASEREELKVLLCMLYGGIKGEMPDMEARMKKVKDAFHLADETGTYPACWNDPVLRKIAQRNWDDMHKAIAKQLGTDLAIVRTMGCPKCHFVFRFSAGYEVDNIPCPHCQEALKL